MSDVATYSHKRARTLVADQGQPRIPLLTERAADGIADPARVGVFGQSFGGYSVMALLAHPRRADTGRAVLPGLYARGRTAELVCYGSESHSLAQSPANVRDVFAQWRRDSIASTLDRISLPISPTRMRSALH